MNMSNLNLNKFFSPKFYHDQRWTIAEPSLVRDGPHGIAMAIDGPPGNAMTIGELHWVFSTGDHQTYLQEHTIYSKPLLGQELTSLNRGDTIH